MPDFEALIRQQQLKQPESDKRLRIVNPNNKSKDLKKNHSKRYEPKLMQFFLAGFGGSVMATLTILFLYANDFLILDISKLNQLINQYI